MSSADRLALLAVLGVEVTLSADGQHLDVSGRKLVVDAAATTLQKHRTELLSHLRARVASEATA